MDDDAKTLLAVLALIYGSSQGIGVFKTALDSVQERLNTFTRARDDPNAAEGFVRARRNELWSSLWAAKVLFYVLLVLAPTVFLAIVAGMGADAALSFLGLHSNTGGTAAPARSPFYWALFVLSIFTTAELLSAYLKGWGGIVKSLFPKKE